jgi:hypothetical protein
LLNLSYISPLQRKYINPQREGIYPLWVKTNSAHRCFNERKAGLKELGYAWNSEKKVWALK